MRILYLNTNHGNALGKFIRFISDKKKSIDVFCFQEADKSLFLKLTKLLKNFRGFRSQKKIIGDKPYSIAIFVSKKTTDGET